MELKDIISTEYISFINLIRGLTIEKMAIDMQEFQKYHLEIKASIIKSRYALTQKAYKTKLYD